MTTKWATLDFPSDESVNGREISALLKGASFRRRNGAGGALGVVREGASGLELAFSHGRVERLTAKEGKGMEFAISPRASGSDVPGGDAPRSNLDIIRACPEWARRTVAAHLLPGKLAAHDKAVKDARLAQLSHLGRVVSGKENARAAEHGKLSATPPAQLSREAREAQLRDIGKAARAR